MGLGGEREDDGGGDFYDEGGAIQGFGGGPRIGAAGGTGPRIDEFGNVVPDFANDPNFPTPFTDYQPGEIAGNSESVFSTKGPGQNPTTSAPRQEAFQLPRGVSVEEAMPQQADAIAQPFDGGNTQNTPPMSMEPAPVSAQTPAPTMNFGAGAPQQAGPQRRSAVSPTIFAENRGSQLSGRAGGLLGGGKGFAGAEEASGPIAPTEMFQKLLQMFRQGS